MSTGVKVVLVAALMSCMFVAGAMNAPEPPVDPGALVCSSCADALVSSVDSIHTHCAMDTFRDKMAEQKPVALLAIAEMEEDDVEQE